MAQNEKMTEYDLWVCCSCKSEPMEHKNMLKHMKSVHKVDIAKGTRKLLMYMHVWKYEWEIKGLKFIQETRHKRKNDKTKNLYMDIQPGR